MQDSIPKITKAKSARGMAQLIKNLSSERKVLEFLVLKPLKENSRHR
jgi:hypothetical protein